MSDNAACRRFEVHDFVPLFARMIKNVKQLDEKPLYAENPHPRCTILFRSGMFLFCSVSMPGQPYFKGARCIVLFRFIDDFATKRELARFCSALIRPIVYFTSKQRSSSATLCRKVPNLFRARAESPFNRGLQAHQGALFCSAFWFVSLTSRHIFVAFSLECSFFVPFSVLMALKKRGSARFCSAFKPSCLTP